MKIPRPAAILFDMDGLLVDTEPVWWLSESAYALELGFQWTKEDQHICVGGPLTRVGDHIVERARAATGQVHDRDAVVEAITLDVASRISDMKIDLMPGGGELLELLVSEGIPHALVSASPRHTVEAVVRSTGITSFFTTIAGTDLSRTKPHPDPYLEAVRRLDVPIAETIILEDSPNGVIGALASGAIVYAIPHLVPVPPLPQLNFAKSLMEVRNALL